MPVDPSISLSASPTGNPAAVGAVAGNPLDTISKFATIQNSLNQNSLFQQTFAAQQKAGQIISAAPDLETGLANLYRDPSTAAFAGTISNNIRQSQLTGIQIAREKQTMAQGALANSIKLLTGVMADPTQFESLIAAGKAVTNPAVRPETDLAMTSIATALSHGLPQGNDPVAVTQRMKMIQARAAGLLTGVGGLTPEAIAQFAGTQRTIAGLDPATGLKTEQGAIQSGPFNPLTPGGAIAPGGSGIVGGMTPGEAVTTHTGPLGSNLQPTAVTGGDIFRGAVPGLGGSMPGGGGQVQAPTSPGNALTPGVPAATAPVGVPTAPAPGQTKVIEGAGQNYTEEGRKAYDSAITGLASVQYMDRAFDEMSRGGGWDIPGTAANQRLGFGKAINTLASISGTPADKLPFDQGKIATWEEFNKESKRAGMQLINQMFGAQRESQMVFQAGASAVPSAENTYLGGKLVLKSLEQTMLREVDRRNFETNWFNTHAGNLVGANEAFNSTYKPQLYSQRAISSVQPYEVSTPDQAANYLPGTIVKRKSDGATFTVTPQISHFPPVALQAQ